MENKKAEQTTKMSIKSLKEFMMYCNDTGKETSEDLKQKWLNGEIKLSFKKLPNIKKDQPMYFIYVESFFSSAFPCIEDGFWVWDKSITKLDYFLVYYVKDTLIRCLYSYDDAEGRELSTFQELTELLKEFKDSKLLEKLNKTIKQDVNTYQDLVKKAYELEEIMYKLELETNFFVFPSFYEARALVYAHGQFDLNDKTISLKRMFQEDGGN